VSYVMLIFKVEDTIRPDEDGFDNEADRERVEGAVVDPLPEALKSALVWGGSWNAVEDIPGHDEYEYEDNVASGLDRTS